MEGNLRLKIDWTSLIVGSKFTIFALFYLVFERNFQVQVPTGLIIMWRAIQWRSFCVSSLGGLCTYQCKPHWGGGVRVRGGDLTNFKSF